jgi:hypothetical protein
MLAEAIERLRVRRDREWLSLKKDRFFEEQEQARKETERLDSLGKESALLRVTSLEARSKPVTDSAEVEKGKRWQDQLARDLHLREAVHVLGDMIN